MSKSSQTTVIGRTLLLFLYYNKTKGEAAIWERLFCYVAQTQTRRTHDPYEKIRFGEGQKPYKNIGFLMISGIFLIKIYRVIGCLII